MKAATGFFSSAILLLALAAAPANADVEVRLKKTFIEKHKNRVTATTRLTIDAAKKVNSAKADGDMHIAGRPDGDIGLMTVAEIQNARDVPDAVAFVRQKAGTDSPVRMSGVWRIWFEHAGNDPQVQGKALKKSKSTNPDHVFELHPVTRIDDIDLLPTLRPIPGYDKPANTSQRIQQVETMKGTLRVAKNTVTIRGPGSKPNYIQFWMKLLPGPNGFQRADGTWTQPADGKFVFAKIYDLEEEPELLVHKRRIAFVKDSEPFRKLENLQPNHCLNVLGITRLNLELVSWRAKNAKKQPDVLTWSLPYEIVAVGVEGDSKHCAEDEDE
jgi:hypothetical protein